MYCNIYYFFNDSQFWSHYEFIATHKPDTIINIEEFLYQDLTYPIEKEYIIQDIKYIEFQEKKKNYLQEYQSIVDYSLFTHQISLGELKELFIKNKIISVMELRIYQHFQEDYKIDSGHMYGALFVLYEKKSVNHNHAQYLVAFFEEGTWTQLYKLVRLAQEVKKKLLVVQCENDQLKIKQIQNV
ncbi:hypothetical protein pb186bvf_013311 [Paramecium bursaria]